MTESRRPSDGTAAAAKIIEIALERPGGHYNAGDTVVGNVILHLPRPIRIKGMFYTFCLILRYRFLHL